MEQLNATLTAAEERVIAQDQLITYLSLLTPDPSNPQLQIVRDASSKELLAVAAVVKV